MTLDCVLKYRDVVLGPIQSCAKYRKEGQNSKFGPPLKEFSTKTFLACRVSVPNFESWVKLLACPLSILKTLRTC